MLYVLTFLGGAIPFKTILFIRIPLILADISILVLLSRFLNGMEKKLLKYYWLSPVLIYVTYIHGQLDVIPIMFLLLSVYFLFKKKLMYASVILGLGMALKTNLLLIIPFCLLFLWKGNNEKKLANIVLFFLGALGIFFLLNLPYLQSPDIYKNGI